MLTIRIERTVKVGGMWVRPTGQLRQNAMTIHLRWGWHQARFSLQMFQEGAVRHIDR